MKEYRILNTDETEVDRGHWIRKFVRGAVTRIEKAVGVIKGVGRRVTSCVDGREDEAVVGSPGGDAARLMEVGTAIVEVTGTKLDDEKVDGFFRFMVGKMGGFYMHTDEHAMEALYERVKEDGVFDLSSVNDVEGFYEWLLGFGSRGYSDEERDYLLGLLVNPDYVGCGHIKLALQDIEDYGFDKGVVEGVIKSFFKLLWSDDELKNKLDFVMLEGDHEEEAVVSVVGEVGDETDIPMITPRHGDHSVFVDHPGFRKYLLKMMIGWLKDDDMFSVSDVNYDDILKKAIGISNKGLQETVDRLANGKPVFVLYFS